ncbi:flavodoxin reductase [Qipengyuania sp. 6B39]|uniref:flavodoxin reductase n=1 Tax=Qipengyuania proteolytica TaxID=2867239 RepID=UPI001C89F800|nr:flavodoxin reductase [Qipengyuania proteolytica]MBX7494919.1 flavodoxin reductase [Qipengyuania proteolytica]
MSHTLTLKAIRPITHNVNELTFERPEGYDFQPGQATDFALDRDGWRDEQRPFTFTSLPEAEHLQFTIKSYPSHDGVTEQIGMMQGGEQVIIEDPWGAIEDKGPGTFIAGGAGLTPFLSILRARQASHGTLDGYRLIFANSEEKDIILREELERMPGLELDLVLSDEKVEGMHHGQVDGDYLDKAGLDFGGTFYLCGPPPMEEAVASALKVRGVSDDRLVMEEG